MFEKSKPAKAPAVLPTEKKLTEEEFQRQNEIGILDRTIGVLVGGIELFSNMTFKGSDLRKGADFLDYMQSLKMDLKERLKTLKAVADAPVPEGKPEPVGV